jgi:hypothetical protein
MSGPIERTMRALLELGLEDLIPLPEALDAPEVRAAVGSSQPRECVRQALANLLRDGKVRAYRGRWDSEPVPISTSEALELLRQAIWYEFHPDNPDEERIYFENVENIKQP